MHVRDLSKVISFKLVNLMTAFIIIMGVTITTLLENGQLAGTNLPTTGYQFSACLLANHRSLLHSNFQANFAARNSRLLLRLSYDSLPR